MIDPKPTDIYGPSRSFAVDPQTLEILRKLSKKGIDKRAALQLGIEALHGAMFYGEYSTLRKAPAGAERISVRLTTPIDRAAVVLAHTDRFGGIAHVLRAAVWASWWTVGGP